MKKIIVLFAIFQMMLISVNAQSSAEKSNKLRQLNKLVIDKYKAGNLKDASEAAHSALDLAIEIFGNESNETAVSYYNLGEIYKARKKFTEASTYLRKSLEIYQLKSLENKIKIAQNLESLIVVLTLDGKTDEATKIIGDLVATAEKAFGSESKDIIPYLKTATDFYIYTKDYEKAENLFARRYVVSKKEFGEESDELEKIDDDFSCYLSRFSFEQVRKKQENYHNLTAKKNQTKPESVGKTISGGVVNGKAYSLPKPDYPSSARQRGARGAITVKILIDENGKVVKARAICGGDIDLQKASEDAAMKAKFRPTQLEGYPVKVSGIITYMFN